MIAQPQLMISKVCAKLKLIVYQLVVKLKDVQILRIRNRCAKSAQYKTTKKTQNKNWGSVAAQLSGRSDSLLAVKLILDWVKDRQVLLFKSKIMPKNKFDKILFQGKWIL